MKSPLQTLAVLALFIASCAVAEDTNYFTGDGSPSSADTASDSGSRDTSTYDSGATVEPDDTSVTSTDSASDETVLAAETGSDETAVSATDSAVAEADPCASCSPSTSDSCSAGTCTCGAAAECTAGKKCCGAGCIDTASDPTNCGVCGKACGTDQLCVGGTCKCDAAKPATSCSPGNRCCGGPITGCSNVCLDNKNCGGCGITCGGSPGICYYGQCWSVLSAKPVGLAECK